MQEYCFFAPIRATEKSRVCKHQATNQESVVRRRGQVRPHRRIRRGGKIETRAGCIADVTVWSRLSFGKACS